MRPNLRTRFREYGLTSGTLGSTAGQTVMVVLLPVLLAEYAPSAFLIGVVVGGEGLFAVMVPYWVGAWSDDLPRGLAHRFGRRGFYLLVTAPLMAAALALVPFVSGFWTLAAIAFVFFAAFHGYLTPLWALLVDAVPEARRGRVQGVRGALHSAGLAYGLVAGGLLFALWRPLPFLLAALLVLLATAATLQAVPDWARTDTQPDRRASGASGERSCTARTSAGSSWRTRSGPARAMAYAPTSSSSRSACSRSIRRSPPWCCCCWWAGSASARC